jgi:crossover junction endodeoxyribonuclease RusA
MIALTLPWPVSINAYWKQRVMTVKGRPMSTTYVSKEGKQFQKDVANALGNSRVPHDGRLAVSIVLFQPDRRARDIDNVVKPLLDSLTVAKFWNDDSQIDELTVKRGPISREKSRAEVVITILKEADRTLLS